MRHAAFTARASRRSSPRRAVHSGKAAVGPCQRSSSTSPNSFASTRSVASRLKSNACSRRSPRISGGKSSERAVAVDQTRRADRADAGDARIAVGGVADQREPVGDELRVDAELLAHAGGVADRLPRRSTCTTRSPRRTAPGPCRASRCRPSRHARPRRRCAPPRRARRPPRARPSATPRRPSRRAPPRADGTARTAPARCPRRSCSPARGRCGTTRSRDRWRRRCASRPSRSSAAPCAARRRTAPSGRSSPLLKRRRP